MITAHDLIEQVLALSVADDAVVVVTDVSEASLRWANSSMTTNGASTYRKWSLVSFIHGESGTSIGVVNSTSVDAGDIPDIVRASEETARSAEPTTETMPLVDGSSVDDAWTEPPVSTGAEVFTALVGPLSRGFDGTDNLFGFAHHQVHTTWLGTSTGVRRRWVQHTGSLEINGKRDYGTHVASAWVGAGTKDFTDIDVDSMLSSLDVQLGWARTRVELPAGRYDTILPPSAVSDLLVYMLWSMSGRGAHEGRNAFARSGGTRLGEKLTDLPLTLTTDPHASGIESMPFIATSHSGDDLSVFDNGLDLPAVDWIRDGHINALAFSRAGAQEFGNQFTFAADNATLTGGSDATVDDMIRSTKRGLLLTCLWYIREVDPTSLLLTGLTRDGVYLIEDGKVVGAVNNFRFNESPIDLLRRVTEAGASERTLPREWGDWFNRAIMAPLRIPDFHMSSVSKAT
ncbi:TldD/PmbA family protein [Hoyosella rhizosphaerae]|uniref:Metalloprotease TldD/E C-terminal domain-containing protein n=1 Tax=Hoyosella rhizosphaerae TaxID=1755582 RepID=A0A916U2K2_9ACTN|nr:metallopeptidase TldD-related protein [Hoyosella rhizosphaerae]MBN4926722.1 TldD/PmbA family protein [Hoyosella rhizosphaerae]GGC56942.1 hypothetical protein GCM10011410_06840 [Hoyosella rhizosphaerae]